MPSLIFRKGLDLKQGCRRPAGREHHSAIVERIKTEDFTYRAGRLTVHLAREFGFCYGVDRAVDYAYQTRERFPDRNVFLTGEIIHNPHVKDKLRGMGIRFLTDEEESIDRLAPSDHRHRRSGFGRHRGDAAAARPARCMIDTTCGSVLNVWKNVRRYAEGGYTSIIHGKVWHEETRATASQAVEYGGKYLVVFDGDETERVCNYIRRGGDRDAFMTRFGKAISPGFDPDHDLQRIGLANQTTMLMTESLDIGEPVPERDAGSLRSVDLASRYRRSDTICSATQDRQDAVVALLQERGRFDLMIVIGGYNSSNTANLARICAASRPTFHIADPDRLVSAQEIRVSPRRRKAEVTATGCCRSIVPVTIGSTQARRRPTTRWGGDRRALSVLRSYCSGPAGSNVTLTRWPAWPLSQRCSPLSRWTTTIMSPPAKSKLRSPPWSVAVRNSAISRRSLACVRRPSPSRRSASISHVKKMTRMR
jgi:4-hydroxy-3-methylbut-2-enyl diphosphate reductase